MTSLAYPIQGIPLSFRVPGSYAEIDFAQGPASASAGVREIVLAMPMLSTGSWTPGVLYPVRSTGVAEAGAGSGSLLHRAVRKLIALNKDAKVWALPVAETSGGSPAAATWTLILANVPTGDGMVTVTVCGEDYSYAFSAGDTLLSIINGLRDAVNSGSWLPVVATAAVATLTITAKLKGISQGTASLVVIRARASITSGTGTTLTPSGAGLGTAAAGADGTTTEAANLASSLTAIDAVRKYYVVSSACDATSWGNLKTHVLNKSLPKQGLRSVAIVAYTGSLSSAQTLAVGKNYERLDIFQQINSEHDCAELAGAWAGARQAGEGVDTAFNFDTYSLDPHILPVHAASDVPDADDQNDAINDGITIVGSGPAGAYVVMSVDTRSKNAAGTQDDFRATETHRISVCDEFADELLALWNLQYSGKKLKDDQRLADGSVSPTQKVVRGVLTPSQLVTPIRKQMGDYEDLGKLQNTASTKAGVSVVKTGSRLESQFDLNVIDLAHQVTFKIAEISQG